MYKVGEYAKALRGEVDVYDRTKSILTKNKLYKILQIAGSDFKIELDDGRIVWVYSHAHSLFIPTKKITRNLPEWF